uniref:Transcription factor bHLH34 n=1 Tax=Lygus hesperus TaxID=30085 RepID=A0A0A9XST5_LYGHE
MVCLIQHSENVFFTSMKRMEQRRSEIVATSVAKITLVTPIAQAGGALSVLLSFHSYFDSIDAAIKCVCKSLRGGRGGVVYLLVAMANALARLPMHDQQSIQHLQFVASKFATYFSPRPDSRSFQPFFTRICALATKDLPHHLQLLQTLKPFLNRASADDKAHLQSLLHGIPQQQPQPSGDDTVSWDVLLDIKQRLSV